MTTFNNTMRTALLACVAATLAACSSPAPPPSLYDVPELAAQLDAEDGIEEGQPLFAAWVGGEPVRYWTLGLGPPNAMPVYRLCAPEGEEDCVALDHPPIVGALPGDDDYAPYSQVHWVELPRGWSGRLDSVDALEAEIRALGLDPPEPSSELWHCPLAGPSASLEVGAGQVVQAETPVYVRGLEARCFDFSATRPNRAVLPGGQLFIRNVYVLRREGEDTPLVEELRAQDLNGDGDQRDSNNLFGVGLEDDDYTPLWRMVMVTIPADTPSIEAEGGQPEVTDAAQLFDVAPDYTITPIEGAVLDYELTETLINCPLQSANGTL